MQSPLIFIVDALSDLYISTFVLRFILQWIRASYQSPLAQFVLQITAPLVVPARRVLPSVARHRPADARRDRSRSNASRRCCSTRSSASCRLVSMRSSSLCCCDSSL